MRPGADSMPQAFTRPTLLHTKAAQHGVSHLQLPAPVEKFLPLATGQPKKDNFSFLNVRNLFLLLQGAKSCYDFLSFRLLSSFLASTSRGFVFGEKVVDTIPQRSTDVDFVLGSLQEEKSYNKCGLEMLNPVSGQVIVLCDGMAMECHINSLFPCTLLLDT